MNEKSINVEDAVLNAPEIAFKANHTKQFKQRLIVKEEQGSSFDILISVLLFINSFLFLYFFDIRDFGWQQTVFTLIYLVLGVGYVVGHKIAISKKNMAILVFIVIACIPNALYTNTFLKLCNLVFIHVLQGYWMLRCCGHLMNEKESNWVLYDILIAAVSLPKACVKSAIKFLTTSMFPKVNMRKIGKVILGLFISIPLLLIILPLLIHADTTFQRVFLNMFNLNFSFTSLKVFILSIPLWLYFYASYYGNACCVLNVKEKKESVQQKLVKLSRFSSIVFTTIEFVLCTVYLVFLISTCFTLSQNLSGINVPFSYAQYARNGFFELCFITAINFLVFICIELLNEHKDMHLHIIGKRVLCVETICIIITALTRLGMYIQMYGLTYLRIYSTWFMIVLLGAFLLILYHSFKKGPYILHIVRYACVCFLLLNLIHVDYMIETVNETVYEGRGYEENVYDNFYS